MTMTSLPVQGMLGPPAVPPPVQPTMQPPGTPMPPIGYPDTDEKDHNEIVIRVCEEEGKRINDMHKVFPTMTISPGVQMPPSKRLERGMQRILEGNMGDPFMAQQELFFILSPTYWDDIKQGISPPPRSAPWVQLFPLGYWFKAWHKQFLSDYDAGLKRAERQMQQQPVLGSGMGGYQ